MNDEPDNDLVQATGFRRWLEMLRRRRGPGNAPLWPMLLGAAFDAEFQHERKADASYKGKIFIDRDQHPIGESETEPSLIKKFYKALHSNGQNGCLTFGSERIWIIGYQFPTQGGNPHKKRQADLIGITAKGALVIFEAKSKSSRDALLLAIVEGLDYLTCLLRPKNFEKLVKGFQESEWLKRRKKIDNLIPQGFDNVLPNPEPMPWLIVLAPDSYFAKQPEKCDWSVLKSGERLMKNVQLAFATTDFKSPELKSAQPSTK